MAKNRIRRQLTYPSKKRAYRSPAMRMRKNRPYRKLRPKTSRRFRKRFIQKKGGEAYKTIKLVRNDTFEHRWSFAPDVATTDHTEPCFDHMANWCAEKTKKI